MRQCKYDVKTAVANYLSYWNSIQAPTTTWTLVKGVVNTAVMYYQVLKATTCPTDYTADANNVCVYNKPYQFEKFVDGTYECVWGAVQTVYNAVPLACSWCPYVNDTYNLTHNNAANTKMSCMATCDLTAGYYISYYGQATFCMKRCFPAYAGTAVTLKSTNTGLLTLANASICMLVQDRYGNNIEPNCTNTQFAEPISFYTDRILRDDTKTPKIVYTKTA